MTTEADVLGALSGALQAQVAAAQALVVAIRNPAHRHVSGTLWDADAVIASEQAIGQREQYEVVTARGETAKARVVGRDPGTNLLVLRSETPLAAAPHVAAVARVGELVIAFGAQLDGAASARLGLVHTVGPQWYSRAGGRIEQRIALDIRLGRTEEGGPVFDSQGSLLGMSTLGPPGTVLVIPAATLERVVPQLIRDGRVTRGWLGLGLQTVAVPDALRAVAGQNTGMMVMSLAAGGPGATAGVVPGDILLTLDGACLRGVRRLLAELDDRSVGRTVAVRLLRGGEVLALDVRIVPRPEELRDPA